MQFRLANGSSVSEGELSLVKVRLYGEDDRFPFAYATETTKVCSQKPEDLETDSPLYEAEFDYNAHSARILATLPDGKINIVLELYKKQVNPDKSEELILVARGTRSGVPVALSGSTDVGDIKFVDVLDSVRPTGVTVLGRTKKVDVTLKATPAALDYIVCYGTSSAATTESAVLTRPSGTIDTLGGEPLKDDTQYFLRVFARNEGSLSLPAVRPGTAPVDPKTAPAESDTAFTATTTQQVSPTVQTEVSTGKAVLSWDAVTGATGYCIDSPCFEPTNTTCAADPAKAVASPTTSAKLTDAEAQRLCKSGSAASRRCFTVNDIVSGRDCTFNIHAIGPDNGLGDPQPVTFRSLAPPKFIDARARSSSITLNWSASEGADDYVVLVNNGRSGEPYDCKINDFKGKLSASVSETVLVPPTAVCTTTQTVTPGKTYYISLQAKALGTNVSSPSSEVFVTPLAPLTTTLAKAGTGKIRVMWNAATDAAGYLVYYTTSATDTLFAGGGLLEGGSPLCVEKEKGKTECKNRPKGKESKLVPTTVSETVAGKSVSLNMIELTGASNGTPYYVTVTSFSNDPKVDSDLAEPEKELMDEAESDPAPKLSVTPLAAPSGVKVSAGDATVRVAWSQVTGADGYCVQSDCVPGAPKCVDAPMQSLANEISEIVAKTCPAESTGLRCFELKNVTNGSSCGFQVFALHGTTDLSDPSSALPGVPVATPKDVTADGGTGQAVLTWPMAILGAQGVEVQYDKDQGVPYQSKLSFSGVGLKQAAITGLTNGVQYWFVVKGTNTSNGTSPASTEVTTIPLAAPVISIQSGTQSLTITWTAVTGATSYNVHYDTDNGQEPFGGKGSATGDSPVSKTDAAAKAACPTGSADTLRCASLTGLTNGQTYYVAVKAAVVVADPRLNSVSSLSNSKSTQPIPAPANVRINAVSDVTNASVQLSWDAVTGATGYNVYYDTDPLKPPLKQGTKLTPTGTVTTALISSLTSNKAYYFSVAAVNADGGSDASAAYLAATRLDTPTGVKVRGGSGRAAVSWTKVTGGGDYRVYWDPTSGKVSTGTSTKPAVLSTCPLPADAFCPGGASSCCGIVCGDDPSGCAAPNLTNGAATYVSVRAEKAACATIPPVDTTNNCSTYATCTTASGTCAPPEFKATPLSRPTDFKVPTSGTVVTSSRIDTSWISPGGTFTGYKLYYDTDFPGAPYTGTGAAQGFSPTLLANSLTTLQLTGLTSNLTYFLSLAAYSGDPNNPDAESDPRRTTLAAAAAAGDLVLSVDSVDGFALPNPIRLRIESEYIECTGLNAAAAPDQFTPCTRGMYGTTAVAHASGTIVYGDLMQATLIPAPATATLVLGTGQAKLTWTAVAGAGEYELYCGSLLEGAGADVPYDNVLTGCNTVETAAAFQVSSGTLTKTFTGLTNGSTPTPINPYRFAVRAKTDPNPATCAPGPPTAPTYYALTSTNNCGDLTSVTSPLLSGVPLAAPAPTATTQNGNQVNAGWSAVPQADGYRIYYWSGGSPNCATPAVPSCPSPGTDCGPFSTAGIPCSTKWSGTDAVQGVSPIQVCNGAAGSLTLTGLTADRRYWITATAVKYSGAGCTGTLMTESDTGGGGGVFVDTTIPAPTGVVAKFNEGTNAIDGPNYKRDNKPHIVLQWNAEPSATSYKIYYDDAGSCPSGGAPTYGYTGTAPNLALNPNPATASPISYTPALNSGTLTVTLTGAAYGTTYVLGVQTVTGASESTPSCTPPATVLTPVPPPTSITAAPRRAAATLTPTAMGTADTTITVNSTTGFDVPTYLKIESEEISCTAATATTFSTCTRGINGTTAATHVVNTSVIGTTGGVVFNWATVPNSDGTILWYGSAPDNYTCTGPPDPSCKKAISISVLPAGNCKDPATGNDTGSPPTTTTPPVDLCNGAYTSASLGGFSSSYRYYYSLGSETEDGKGDLSTEQTFLALTPGWGSPAMAAGGGGTISLLWQRSAMATDYEIHYDTVTHATDTNAATVPPLPRSDQSPYAGAAGLTPAAAAIVGFSWAANLNTTLSAAVTSTDANIPVTSIGSAGTFGLPVTVGIESEKLSCPTVNVGASRFEGCTRGFGGTTAAAHSGGTIVSAGYCRDTNTTDNNAECQISGLVPGTIYYFAVRIVSQGGKSAFSEERQTLDAPTLKNPIPSTGQAKLEWTTVTGADQYKFGRSTVSGACNSDFGGVTCPSTTVVGASPTFPQTQTGLTNGTQYYFVVRAENASNGSVSPNSTERTAKPLAKPATAMSGSAGTAYVSVNWSAVAGSNNYTIGRAAGTTLAVAATSGDTTLKVNSAAGFVAPVTFKIDTEEIRCTTVATAPTPDELQSCTRAQNGTTAAAHSLGAYIVPTCRTWEYKIGTPDPPGPPADAAPSGCTPTTQAGTSKTFTPLTNGTVYGLWVRAEDTANNGASDWDGEVLGRPVAQPSGITAAAATGQVTLTWTTPTAGADNIQLTRYTGVACGTLDNVSTEADTSPLTVTGLTDSVSYSFTLTAKNTTGATVGTSTVSACVYGTALSAPTLTTNCVEPNICGKTGSVDITFTVPVAGADSYEMCYRTTAGWATGFTGACVPAGTTVLGASPAMPRTIAATNGEQRFWAVRAKNTTNNGQSAFSAELNATALAAPTGLSAAIDGTVGSKAVKLSWTAPACVSPGGTACMTGYKLYYDHDPAADVVEADYAPTFLATEGNSPVSVTPGSTVTQTLTGLRAANPDYTFAVAAVANNSRGNLSGQASGQTPRYGERTTWPFVPGVLLPIASSPAALEFDGDAPWEIVIGGNNDIVYALNADKSNVASSWPYTTVPAGDVQSCAAIADIASTPAGAEVVIANDAGTIFVLKNDGTLASSTALSGATGLSCPVIGDIDGDAGLEVVVLARNGAAVNLYRFDVTAAGGLTGLAGSPTNFAGELIGATPNRGVTPALAEIDAGCNGLEIIFGDGNGNLHVVCGSNGAAATNCAWPVDADGGGAGGPALNNSPAVATNVDADAFAEIIIGSEGGNLFKIEGDTCAVTTLLPGLGAFRSSPALGNLDGATDPEVEIAVGNDNGNVYAINGDGTALANFPKAAGAAVRSSPAIADYDNSGNAEIFVGDSSGLLHGYRAGLAGELPGFPVFVSSGNAVISSPAVADLDSPVDGKLEIIIGSDDGKVHVFNIEDTAAYGTLAWPMFHRNARRTGN